MVKCDEMQYQASNNIIVKCECTITINTMQTYNLSKLMQRNVNNKVLITCGHLITKAIKLVLGKFHECMIGNGQTSSLVRVVG